MHPTKGLEAVKVGRSWPAFFFGPIWMLVKKLWLAATLWCVVAFGLGMTQEFVEKVSGESTEKAFVQMILAVANLSVVFCPVFFGNRWREANLAGRGFTHVNTVQAQSPDAAIAIAVNRG